jgi:O-methyltransferase
MTHARPPLHRTQVFVTGFFNETMGPLSRRIRRLSIMRLDGDMYESTVDVLYHLYDKLSVGGYVIMDDWEMAGGKPFPAKRAVEDFCSVHGINPMIYRIDDSSVYWQKTEDVQLQYWRYQQNRFKPGDRPAQ